MDGLCKCVTFFTHGCKECKKGNVQFLFLFDDCFAGIVCQQGIAPSIPQGGSVQKIEADINKTQLKLNKEILYKSAPIAIGANEDD